MCINWTIKCLILSMHGAITKFYVLLTLKTFYQTVLRHIADGHAILRVMSSHISGFITLRLHC